MTSGACTAPAFVTTATGASTGAGLGSGGAAARTAAEYTWERNASLMRDAIERAGDVDAHIKRPGFQLRNAAADARFQRDVEVRIDAEWILKCDRAADDLVIDVLESDFPTFVERHFAEDHGIRERAGDVDVSGAGDL